MAHRARTTEDAARFLDMAQFWMRMAQRAEEQETNAEDTGSGGGSDQSPADR